MRRIGEQAKFVSLCRGDNTLAALDEDGNVWFLMYKFHGLYSDERVETFWERDDSPRKVKEK